MLEDNLSISRLVVSTGDKMNKKIQMLTKEDVCNIIVNLLFENNITKFNFKGTKSKFKLDVYYGDKK